MNHKLLTITAICATMMACNSKTETVLPTSVELPGTVDNEAFANNVESISVMNLQMDDAWTLTNAPWLALSNNYIYLLEGRQLRLTCLDRHTGGKLSGRTIKGNGPGEILGLNSIFCVGDTLCIYDNKNFICKYDHNCGFVGKTHEFSNIPQIYNLLPLGSQKYAFVALCQWNTSDLTNKAILLTDSSFNITSEHFSPPQLNLYFAGNNPCYVDGDTLRVIFLYDNKLYTLFGESEQCTELGLPNPLTPEIANELFESDDDEAFNKYDGVFRGLCGSGRSLFVKYYINNVCHSSFIDKRTNKAVTIIDDDKEPTTTADLVCDFFKKITIIKSEGKYIYAYCNVINIVRPFKIHANLLDERLLATKTEFDAYLERNAEYIKDLEPDERVEANVILKIKLKD
ncbi:MAG: 6-bladed beta-propeller [Salinivirgaceae bacterium]|nr:6-bladed beta-propeller [Salinivirgaceae bacterium]